MHDTPDDIGVTFFALLLGVLPLAMVPVVIIFVLMWG